MVYEIENSGPGWNRAVAEAGRRNILPGMRRFLAERGLFDRETLTERGVTPATLKYLMGHENEATTAKFYRRPTWDGIEHAREAISRSIQMDVQSGRAAGLS